MFIIEKNLILGKCPTSGLADIKLTAEILYNREYAMDFSEQQKKFCLDLHYNNGKSSYLFVNIVKIYKLKAKDSEIHAAPLCLDKFSKDFSTVNMKNTG